MNHDHHRTLPLQSDWWVSPSAADAELAARNAGEAPSKPEESGAPQLIDLYESCEPDNYPRRYALHEMLEGLQPVFGWREDGDPGAPRRLSPYLTYAQVVNVPEDWAGKTLFLYLNNARYSVKVSVNGQEVCRYVGGLEPHRINITDALRPGEGNLISITVGDSGTSGHRTFDTDNFTGTRLPTCKEIENNLVHPVVYGGSDRAVGEVRLEAVSRVRTDFVFANPKVSAGLLQFTVSLVNDTDNAVRVRVRSEALGAKLLVDETVELEPHKDLRLVREIPWADAILWDTDNPHLYDLETTLHEGDTLLDRHRDTFGFREFSINGHSFFLNGKKIHLHGQSGHTRPDRDIMLPLEEKIKVLRLWKEQGNVNHIRLHATPQDKGWVEAADRVGMLITTETALWTTGMHSFDWAGSEQECYENVRNHFFEALVRRDRNNPSVILWSLSNEMSPITPLDLENPKMAAMTRIFDKIIAEAEAEDSSRVIQMSSAMDFLGRLKLYNLHYPKNWQAYPDFPHTAYWLEEPFLFRWYGAGRFEMPSWSWRRDKPLVFGEFTCVFGVTPDNQSSIVGDAAFEEADFGTALVNETLWPMEINAYRRKDVSGFTAWACMCFEGYQESLDRLAEPYVQAHTYALRPLAVICHTYRRRWFAGDEVPMELSIHNDTRKDVPLELVCQVLDAGRVLWTETMPQAVYGPAENVAFTNRFRVPNCREERTFTYRAELHSGQEVVDEWELPIQISPKVGGSLPAGAAFLDPSGEMEEFFGSHGLQGGIFLEDIADPESLQNVPVLWVNFDRAKLHAREWKKTFPVLRKFVEDGGTVILDDPPEFAWHGLPTKITNGKGYADGDRLEITYAYPTAPRHPVMQGLTNEEFRLWGEDLYIARRCFEIPQEGNARPLLAAGTDRTGLICSPLLELPAGRGRWYVNSLEIVSKIAEEPVAQRILKNLLLHSSTASGLAAGAAVAVKPEIMSVLREIGFLGDTREIEEALASEVSLVDASLFDEKQHLPLLERALQEGKRVCLHAAGVEQTKAVLAGLGLPGTVLEGGTDGKESDTIRHSHPMSDGMSSNYLYWIVDKEKVPLWTLAPVHSNPASALIALAPEEDGARSITRRGATVVFPVGSGLLVIDNLHWEDRSLDEPERARRYAMTLLTNLGIPLTHGANKRLSEDYETEAEKRERGHF